MEPKNNDSKYFKAKQRVSEMKKFYSSLVFYFVFIVFLAAVNYYTNQWEYPWFLWAAFGWGIGLLFKALKIFDWNPFLGKGWEQRKLNQYMEEEEKRNNKNWN